MNNIPDLLIFDGHGIAHPRGFGIASHIGIILDIPTIGCAKKKLIGSYREPGKSKGSHSILFGKNKEILGSVLRTRDSVKPVFISPGHKINVKSARDIIQKCVDKYRIPYPIRLAHIESNLARLGKA